MFRDKFNINIIIQFKIFCLIMQRSNTIITEIITAIIRCSLIKDE